MSKLWMAVYTKPRSEKKVAERLEKVGIEVYCPLQTVIKQWSDRKKKVKIPVFPSYVFVHVGESERLTVLSDAGVMNFVFWLGKPAVIREEEIEVIKEYLERRNNNVEVVGDEVLITHGIFEGTKGKIKHLFDNKTVLVIESIGITITITHGKEKG
jgi:transcriptional antiterminator RfaH